VRLPSGGQVMARVRPFGVGSCRPLPLLATGLHPFRLVTDLAARCRSLPRGLHPFRLVTDLVAHCRSLPRAFARSVWCRTLPPVAVPCHACNPFGVGSCGPWPLLATGSIPGMTAQTTNYSRPGASFATSLLFQRQSLFANSVVGSFPKGNDAGLKEDFEKPFSSINSPYLLTPSTYSGAVPSAML
jgi:hypothetical protein